MMTEPSKRVLSIQSHVVSGYVGNKAATFPLQTLGYDVDCINSVHFSNHTGYPSWTGDRLNGEQLYELYDGLRANDLLDYTHVLTGYIGSVSFLQSVIRIVNELKQRNDDVIYVCDPVMGDDGKLYVPEELVPVFRDQLCPLADVLTPNHFEAELLTGKKISTETDVLAVLDILHTKGPQVIVLTSCTLNDNADHISVYGSSRVGDKCTRFKANIARLPGAFTGTGDLFSALLLVWTDRLNGNAAEAAKRVIATMQAVLRRTHAHARAVLQENPATNTDIRARQAKARELRLIQSKSDIEDPDSLPVGCEFVLLPC